MSGTFFVVNKIKTHDRNASSMPRVCYDSTDPDPDRVILCNLTTTSDTLCPGSQLASMLDAILNRIERGYGSCVYAFMRLWGGLIFRNGFRVVPPPVVGGASSEFDQHKGGDSHRLTSTKAGILIVSNGLTSTL